MLTSVPLLLGLCSGQVTVELQPSVKLAFAARPPTATLVES